MKRFDEVRFTHMSESVMGKATVCALGILAFISIGCRKNVSSMEEKTSPSEQAAPASAVDPWTTMESLGTARWREIEADEGIEWDDAERTLKIGFGNDLNGVRWEGALPTVPYVVELEARRMSGSDFFCGLTFPVRSGKEHVSLIIGGWGGNLVGISSIDGMDASENSTGSAMEFEDQRWYRIRLEVREEQLQAWIDDKQVVDAHTEGLRLSLRPGPIESCAPFGLATWQTKAEIRGIRWRGLTE